MADVIDKEIYKNYHFFPINYVAYDLMEGNAQFAHQYTEEEKSQFETYLEQQVEKVNLKDKDEDYLRDKIIEMYANTLKNHLKVSTQ